ncbi:hypothetical protein [Roseimaritima sediminicola]|uniref:hypothetical protein n=1 Tax=Roseimaritima sediminicola TaxID=2662066 RepID=UPI00129851D4|nr:hypothetical protein [Roseimaritima sediminicola]
MNPAPRSFALLLLCGVLAVMGCGGDAPNSTESLGAGEAAADSEFSPATQSVRTVARPMPAGEAASGTGSQAAARRLLETMLARYRAATAYQDRGVVRLSYRQNGVPQTDVAPLSVQYRAPDRVSLHAYSVQLVCDSGRLMAQVVDPTTDNFDGQRLLRNLDQAAVTMQAIYADPVITQLASAGLGGPSPQLELLLGETPLSGLVGAESRLSLGKAARLDGYDCQSLQIETESIHYVLWIDRQALLLRRIELPLVLVPGLLDDVSIEDAHLTIDLTAASWTPPAEQAFALPPRQGGPWVERMVPLPPPLESPLLGKTAEAFELSANEASGSSPFRVNHRGSDRDIIVLLWVARHEGSQAAALALDEIEQRLDERTRRNVRFLIVMTEAGPPTGQTLGQWDVTLPWTDDTEAVGRDVFGVQHAPALSVLGRGGTVQWFQHPLEPGAMQALPQVIADLQAGAEVGRTLAEDHQANQQAYRAALHEAAATP